MAWDTFLNSSGNPRVPTFGEAMVQTLSPAERAQLTAELRPQVEKGLGERRSAVAYLTARRS